MKLEFESKNTREAHTRNCFYKTITQSLTSPEIAGVRMPSPMTMQVPIRARMSKTLCRTLCFSNVVLSRNAKLLSGAAPRESFLYSDNSSSATWQFGSELTRAWRHSNEYNANVPPSPLSSALSTTNTYLTKGTRVIVQNTSDKTPKTSSLLSVCLMSSANVLLKTYNGEMLKSPYTTPRLWYARVRTVLHDSLCNKKKSLHSQTMTRTTTITTTTLYTSKLKHCWFQKTFGWFSHLSRVSTSSTF